MDFPLLRLMTPEATFQSYPNDYPNIIQYIPLNPYKSLVDSYLPIPKKIDILLGGSSHGS